MQGYLRLFAASLLASGSAHALVEGDRDPTFNGGHVLQLSLSPASDPAGGEPTVIGVTTSDSGGYVVATTFYEGSNSYANQLNRFKADGSPDTLLNGTGNFTHHGPQMTAMTRRPDILDVTLLTGNYSDGEVVLCANIGTGAADMHFAGTNGCRTYLPAAFGMQALHPLAIATQAWDGDIVIAGSAFYGIGSRTYDEMFALRLLPNGDVDTAFGVNGLRHYSLAGAHSQALAIAFDANHKIVLAGTVQMTANNNDFAALRLDSDGTVEGLEPGGIVPTMRTYDFHGGQDSFDFATNVHIDSAGRIYLAGQSESLYSGQYGRTYAVGVVRLLPNFALDDSFSSGTPALQAYVEENAGGYETDCYPDFALDDQQRPLIAGGDTSVLAVWRLSDGVSDPTYNNHSMTHTGRIAVTRPPSQFSSGEFPHTRPRILFDGDKPFVAGVTAAFGNYTAYQLSVSRLLGDDTIMREGFDN